MKPGTGNSRESCPLDGIFKPRRYPIYIHPRYQSVLSTPPSSRKRELRAASASRFRFISRPSSPARFPCGDAARTRPAGVVSRFSVRLAPPRSRGEPRNDGAEPRNGCSLCSLLPAGFYAPRCSATFSHLAFSLRRLSPRHLGAAESITFFDGVALLIPRCVTSLLFPRRGEFLPRSPRCSRKWNKREQRRDDRN